MRSVHAAALPFHPEVASTYWNATFCWMPGGDDVTRKATLDALLLGCIPVFFHKGAVRQWLWHWGLWVANATVVLDADAIVSNATHPVDALLAIPDERVQQMQRVIATNAHTMHWALPRNESESAHEAANTSGDDAFHVTLRAVHARTVDVGEGTRLQQHAGQQRTQRLRSLIDVNRSLGGRQGQCPRSTGAMDRLSCTDNASAPWLPPRPLLQTRISIHACIALCNRCARCRYASYSLLLRACAWHHTCDLTKLPQHYEFWSYLSFEVKKHNHTRQGGG